VGVWDGGVCARDGGVIKGDGVGLVWGDGVEGALEQVLEGGVGVEGALVVSVVAVGDVVGVGVVGACALSDSFSCGGDAFGAGELLEGAVGFGATLTVNPPAPMSLTLSPSTVPGGRSATATVFLNASAPPGGLWLRVSHNNPNRVWAPSQVYVPAGMRSVRFTVYTYRGRGVASVQITVATDGGSRSAILTVR
jgi:hypothetical protein